MINLPMMRLRIAAAVALVGAAWLLDGGLLAAPAVPSNSASDKPTAATDAGKDEKQTPARTTNRTPTASKSAAPASPTARTAANRAPSPEVFFPSEEIPSDRPISLPADI